MNGTQSQALGHGALTAHAEHRRRTLLAGGAILEEFGAIATIALAIVGLAGVFQTTMAAIAAIVLGAAILMEGGEIEWKNGRITRPTWGEGSFFDMVGMADWQAGIGAIVLGVLALLGISSVILLSVALLAVGAAFLFTGRFLSGLAGLVLGILAVVGVSSLPLVLVGFLVLGAGLLFAGAGLTARTLAEGA